MLLTPNKTHMTTDFRNHTPAGGVKVRLAVLAGDAAKHGERDRDEAPDDEDDDDRAKRQRGGRLW